MKQFFESSYIINLKGGHGLHRGSFKLQTMTALIKSFCGGVQGGQFFQKAPPLAAGGSSLFFRGIMISLDFFYSQFTKE